jgi:hypothetical protein
LAWTATAAALSRAWSSPAAPEKSKAGLAAGAEPGVQGAVRVEPGQRELEGAAGVKFGLPWLPTQMILPSGCAAS